MQRFETHYRCQEPGVPPTWTLVDVPACQSFQKLLSIFTRDL